MNLSFGLGTRETVADLPTHHHRSPVYHISLHPTLPLAITSSKTEAVLWDTYDWRRVRVLTGIMSADLYQASLSPLGDHIITHSVEEVLVWDITTFELLWRLTAPMMSNPSPSTTSSLTELSMGGWTGGVCFDIVQLSKDGRTMVVGGKSTLFVWKERNLVRPINTSKYVAGYIAQVEFAGSKTIHSFTVSPDGRFLALIPMMAKSTIEIWDMQNNALLSKGVDFNSDETASIFDPFSFSVVNNDDEQRKPTDQDRSFGWNGMESSNDYYQDRQTANTTSTIMSQRRTESRKPSKMPEPNVTMMAVNVNTGNAQDDWKPPAAGTSTGISIGISMVGEQGRAYANERNMLDEDEGWRHRVSQGQLPMPEVTRRLKVGKKDQDRDQRVKSQTIALPDRDRDDNHNGTRGRILNGPTRVKMDEDGRKELTEIWKMIYEEEIEIVHRKIQNYNI
ncbi:WD40-repeat-containing domain protein [Endogone sp. FLAS-F59071]|nr:WD40-repeat-containing domain protein [Endogone sp. FLAS-F59071]|eukprot:RUS19736.1 WD40-repeat-containing domain protein [Endogone sp. FLAS-F59071]